MASLVLAAGSTLARADVQPSGAMLRFPDISATHIAFVYANDIWVAPRDGGMAQPLSSPPGAESFPRFSPDGKEIAFAGNYAGNRDLYTIAVGGGAARRVTHHPGAETLCDWTADGKGLVFMSNGLAGLARQTQLFTVPATGGLPVKMPMPYSGFGSVNAAGDWVAFTPHSTDTRTWKRYRGGMATDLWLLNLKTNASKQITDWEGTDTLPMWGFGPASNTVFYLSDAGPEHRLNVWSYDTGSGVRTQITTFKDDDVRWPSIGPGPGGGTAPWGEVVFQLGSSLRVLDLATKQTREVKITIPGDRPTLMTRDEDASATMQGSTISPTGKRVLAVGRGDIFSLPVKEGVVRNLTRTDNVFDRDPAWSPDGRWMVWFSDASGEYEMWLRKADGRSPEEEKKDDEDKGDKKDAKEGEDAAKKDGGEAKAAAAAGPTEPVKLTDLGPGFRYSPVWSPDSKHVAFTDKGGRLQIATISIEGATATAKVVTADTNPQGDPVSFSWSSDSNWIAYLRTEPGHQQQSGVWLYNVAEGKATRVISPVFNCGGVAFDRKGEHLFVASSRSYNPQYADLDTTFIYPGTEVLLMVPLREDLKNPFAPRSDEEEFKKDEKPKADAKKKDDAKGDAKPEAKGGEGKKDDAAKVDEAVTGTWEGTAKGGNLPAELPFTMRLSSTGGTLRATVSSAMGTGSGTGTFDAKAGTFSFTATVNGRGVTFSGEVQGESAKGTWQVGNDGGSWTTNRTSKEAPAIDDAKAKEGGDKAEKDKKKPVKIDLEGFERRAVQLPVSAGNFGEMAVSDDGKLIYVRRTARGAGGEPGIKIFDLKDESREEKAVTSGGNFEMSADGKKLLVRRGGSSMVVVDASAGGGKAQTVSTAGMRVRVRPREEWKQIFNEVYRLQRDFFYEETLHGVDWAKTRDHYGAMIDDCSNREDVAWVIAEFISELNIGHAYVTSPGDVEDALPPVGVGMLGCDYALETTPEGTAYRIIAIHEGGPWDSDARGPLSQPGEKKHRVNVGDFLLAVNGTPIDTTLDPWAAFRGMADRPTTITVSSKPVMDAAARDVLIKPIASETNLRYRAWIEAKRQHVEKQSEGQIGYIYVPNTGVDGQSDLIRQYYGQMGKAALIIDERWNGGGQIPTRFIELLNRPVTNYWARRDGTDWTWPPDSHQGPKAMLINGLAGSGGDMFPWLFKFNKIGKTIGTRTWGGLVGISGNPGLIDGGAVSVPTFGFYKKDGTWGVEGHGVDPDMVVIDDPGKMTSTVPVAGGADPQLDAAIAHLLGEIKTSGYTPAKRPAGPDRKGMGIPERDR